MPKSPDAFRTISEVADWLDIQAHVLRFWESKFTQVKPIKRAGGRRYYRPADMQLLGGIKKLLHDDGLTIKGVQKILREEGMSHVASLSIPLDDVGDAAPAVEAPAAPAPAPEPEPTGIVLPFETEKDMKDAPEAPEKEEVSEEAEALDVALPDAAAQDATPVEAPQDAPETAPGLTDETQDAPDVAASTVEDAQDADASPDATADPGSEEVTEPDTASPETAARLPSFLHRPLADAQEPPASDNVPPEPEAPAPAPPPPAAAESIEPAENVAEPEPAPAPKPRQIELPAFTPEDQIEASPGTLAMATRLTSLTANDAGKIAPLLAQLTALREQMAQKRRPVPRS